MSKGAGATGKDVTGTIIKGVFHLGEIFFYKGNLRLRHPIRCVASSDAPKGADRRTQSFSYALRPTHP